MMASDEDDDDDDIRMDFGNCCELLNWTTPATVIIMLGRRLQVEEFSMQIDV